MDEAFLPFGGILQRLLAFDQELVDPEAGVRSHITRYEIETPVELDITRDAAGELRIGSTPPIYYVNTSIRPSFHRLRVVAELNEHPDGE